MIRKLGLITMTVSGLVLLSLPDTSMAQRSPRRFERRLGRGLASLARNEHLQKELGLAADQVDRLRQVQRKSRIANIDNRAKLQIMQMELGDLLQAEVPDRAAIDTKIDEITHARALMMKSRIEVGLATREVLTPEQWTQLKEIRRRAVEERMERRHRRPRRQDRERRRDGPPAPVQGL